MMRIDTAAMYARVAVHRPHDPFGPADFPQEHRVTLPAPTTYAESVRLWDDPQKWCREQMKERGGEKWSRHRVPRSGEAVFTFDHWPTAFEFMLRFR